MHQHQVQQRNIKCQTLILFTFHLFTFHGLIHLLNGIIQKLIHTEITLSDNSSILALENSFLCKIESKQLIHLIYATKFPVSATTGSATPATHTHTQACAQSATREGSCDRSLPVAYWCYRTKQFVLRDFTSRIRMTTRGLGVSRSVCKNALHLHLDCSELF